MNEPPLPTGKLDPGLLAQLLPIGRPAPAELLLGPRLGEDAAAIAVDRGVLIAAADPITLVGYDVGRHAVLVNANDIAVMGVRPRWFLATIMLPVGTTEPGVRALFEGMHQALAALGVTLVGGHTEVCAAVLQPIVSGHMLGHSADGAFVRTGGLEPGDVVVQIGPAPIEGAAVLASRAPPGSIPADSMRAAQSATVEPGIAVVEPALACARLGAKALHDPTEGGLAAGLWELAESSGVRLEIDPSQVAWFRPGVELCSVLGLDPWGTLASGALLAGFAQGAAGAALDALRQAGYVPSVIAAAAAGTGVYREPGRLLERFVRDEVSRLAFPASRR